MSTILSPNIGETHATEEMKRLIRIHHDALDVINHYGFSGQEDFTRPFRILVIDQGVGDSAIFLAEQLRHHPTQLVYLSTNKNNLEQVKARADIRKLTNIEWIEGSLQQLVALGTQPFDYISCTIPLQYLAAPDDALRLLKQQLTEDGTLLIMVDGRYGRTAIKQIRDLSLLISGDNTPLEERLNELKATMQLLPPNHAFTMTLDRFSGTQNYYSDPILKQLFIEGQNTDFTVPELYELVSRQGLHLLDFVTLSGDSNVRYVPESTLTSPKLKTILSALDLPSRQAAAEILYGTLSSHYCYVSKTLKKRLTPKDTSLVPFFAAHFTAPGMYASIAHHLEHSAEPNISESSTGFSFIMKCTKPMIALCKEMDGKHTIAEIIGKALSTNIPSATEASLLDVFSTLYDDFHQYDWMLLREKHVSDFLSVEMLQKQNKY